MIFIFDEGGYFLTTQKDVRLGADRLITNLYSKGRGRRGELAAFRSTRNISDRYAQRIVQLLSASLRSNMFLPNGFPKYDALAVYNTVRLYALYQQQTDFNGKLLEVYGKKEDGAMELMEVVGWYYHADDTLQSSLSRYMKRVLTAENMDSLMNALLRLVKIIKSQSRPFKIDFSLLAQDLYAFQWGGHNMSRLRSKWGQQFCSKFYSDNREENQ